MSKVARLKIKEIDRDQILQWNMVFNSTVHAKSYLFYKLIILIQLLYYLELITVLQDCEKFVL